MSIRELYSKPVLDSIYSAAVEENNDDYTFAAFQKSLLERVFRGFSYDKFSSSLIEAVSPEDNEGPKEMESVEGVLWGFEQPQEEVLNSYVAASDHDHLSRLTYHNPGRLFLHTDVFEGNFEDSPMCKEHCGKFDIYKDYSICFKLPACDDHYIAFDYIGGKKSMYWHDIKPDQLEYASFLFALAWLCRWNRIGKRTFQTHLIALEGVAGKRLEKLRRFTNRRLGEEDLRAQAESLNVGYKGYDGPLYDWRNTILERMGRDVAKLKQQEGGLPLEVMTPYIFLLGLMGDHTQPPNVPEGLSLTSAYYARMGLQER